VPANQFRLGHEGAGIIRRVGRSVSSHKVGDRVAMDIPGCFANRVQAPIEAIHKIPDAMTFVVSIIFFPSLYSG
jgi:NADPH:quinone reductase-like Zn-dependent oxidoreductase